MVGKHQWHYLSVCLISLKPHTLYVCVCVCVCVCVWEKEREFVCICLFECASVGMLLYLWRTVQPVHEVKGFVSNLNGGRGFPKVFKRNANLTSLHQVCVCVCVCACL